MKRVLIYVCLAMFSIMLLAACENTRSNYGGTGGKANVPPAVEKWRKDVEKYAEQYGISEHVELLLAMIMQESSGDASKDLMRSAESAGLPAGSFTDPQASLNQGIKYFASLLATAEEAGVDVDTALQSYNFGGGYIPYVRDHGGKHTEELARAFSEQMKARTGWLSYGDVRYVAHVRSHMTEDTGSDGDFDTGTGSKHPKYNAMYRVMKEYEGTPYSFGGSSKAGIDCSAMVQKIYEAAGISLPRTAQNQYDAVNKIPNSKVRKGDLVFFTGTYNTPDYISHIGVYTGDGQFFHAGGGKAQFSSLNSDYYQQHFVGYGRK